MKKLLLFILLLIVAKAQEPAKKWVIVQDLEDRIVYMDTSTIKIYDNQISLWGLSRYRTPKRLNPFNTLVKQVKSNFLINTVTNKYSVIGTLYYDKMGKIVGESSAPRITGGEDSFELPVQPGSSVAVLYEKAVNYLNTGTFTAEPTQFTPGLNPDQTVGGTSDSSNNTNMDTETDSAEVDSGPIRLSPEQNLAIVDESSREYLEEQKRIADSLENSTSAIDSMAAQMKLDESNVKKPNPPQNKADLSGVKLDRPKPKKKKPVYNESNDENIRSNIWSDGNLYVIQLSSWRRENVADQQVDKYKADGHNAFKMTAQIPGRGNWFRVRIGYFNSLEEAQNYKRSNNL